MCPRAPSGYVIILPGPLPGDPEGVELRRCFLSLGPCPCPPPPVPLKDAKRLGRVVLGKGMGLGEGHRAEL